MIGWAQYKPLNIIMKLVSLWMLYAIHLNDNSLFCVFTSLDVICSPNVLSLKRWFHSCFIDCTTI